jgi:hypothetical protein
MRESALKEMSTQSITRLSSQIMFTVYGNLDKRSYLSFHTTLSILTRATRQDLSSVMPSCCREASCLALWRLENRVRQRNDSQPKPRLKFATIEVRYN